MTSISDDLRKGKSSFQILKEHQEKIEKRKISDEEFRYYLKQRKKDFEKLME